MRVTRYIVDKNGRVKYVSFGATIVCEGNECVEYTGDVPSGYASLDEWFVAECDKLCQWKIVDGSLKYDGSVAIPEDCVQTDFVIESGEIDGWRYRKWSSGYCELWTKKNIRPSESIEDGNICYSDIVQIDLPFFVSDGVVTGSAHYLHMISNAEVWENGLIVGFRLTRGKQIILDMDIPVQLHINGSWSSGGGFIVTDDGNGNVTIEAYGSASIEDNGAGGIEFIDQSGNAIVDDGAGNVTII